MVVYSIKSNYNKNGKCLRCPFCHGKKFESVIKDVISGIVSEREIVCSDCGNVVNYWAYGFYDPAFRNYDRSLAMLFVRMKDNIHAVLHKRKFPSGV